MRTGMSSNIERKTSKQKKDSALRRKDIAKIKAKFGVGKNKYSYQCSNEACKNLVKFPTSIEGRHIMCSRCNKGFYKKPVKSSEKRKKV